MELILSQSSDLFLEEQIQSFYTIHCLLSNDQKSLIYFPMSGHHTINLTYLYICPITKFSCTKCLNLVGCSKLLTAVLVVLYPVGCDKFPFSILAFTRIRFLMMAWKTHKNITLGTSRVLPPIQIPKSQS